MSGKKTGEANTGTTADTLPATTGNDSVLLLEEHKQQRAAQPLRPGTPAITPPRKEAIPQIPRRNAAKSARLKTRHWVTVASFFFFVAAPTVASWWYLTERATDRYVSTASFSVRSEQSNSPFELLGGVVDIGASSSSDPDILYDFIQSQELVEHIDARVDLRALWAKGNPVRDPVYAYHPPGTIEDMVTYWNRMVSIYNDTSTGIMDLKVQAFTPEDAKLLTELIYDESSDMINRLSDIAQEDATRVARLELEAAAERLKAAREAVTLFRNRHQIVDPQADMQSQMGILTSLQGELASTLIDLDILRDTTAESDPRIVQAEQRIEVIERRIAEERAKLGIGTGDAEFGAQDSAFADLVGEYEGLVVDVEFASQSYAAAYATFETALSDARRQKRYIAAHVRPTLAERAIYPRIEVIVPLVALFSFLAWSLLVLIAYALKDRR
jgi:capsular polysaccharide transport system permease protein